MSGTQTDATDRHVKDPTWLRWQWGTAVVGAALFAGSFLILIAVFDPGTARHELPYDLVRFGAVGLVAFFVWFSTWFFSPVTGRRSIRRMVLGASLAVVAIGSVWVITRL
ncbi:P-loop NTPase family protein [Actinoallomurus rhizosphaericola]|uniref:hypothetical protein n=1 Tax=Actinoallomurus rhizosphaericola TaxID=2952536 RepID=UPI002090EA21|nr:hypothetical protein [Actinoallomurus rhizosphaericola]MCO5992508.1 hypothetical protein [Actinoallomurus rhizosphaericola]